MFNSITLMHTCHQPASVTTWLLSQRVSQAYQSLHHKYCFQRFDQFVEPEDKCQQASQSCFRPKYN